MTKLKLVYQIFKWIYVLKSIFPLYIVSFKFTAVRSFDMHQLAKNKLWVAILNGNGKVQLFDKCKQHLTET